MSFSLLIIWVILSSMPVPLRQVVLQQVIALRSTHSRSSQIRYTALRRTPCIRIVPTLRQLAVQQHQTTVHRKHVMSSDSSYPITSPATWCSFSGTTSLLTAARTLDMTPMPSLPTGATCKAVLKSAKPSPLTAMELQVSTVFCASVLILPNHTGVRIPQKSHSSCCLHHRAILELR